VEVVFAEVDRQERRGGNVEIERAPARRNSGIREQLVEQPARFGAAEATQHIAMQPLDERGGHRFPVDDVRTKSAGMKHQSHRIAVPLGRGCRIGECFDEPRGAAVRFQDRPVAIDDDRRIRLLLAQHEVERAPRLLERRRVEIRRAIHGRVAGGHQQLVAIAQRHVEHAREDEHHFAARLRTAGLDEAHVPRRHARFARKIELAHAAPRAPLAQQTSERTVRFDASLTHARNLHRPPTASHYLGGN